MVNNLFSGEYHTAFKGRGITFSEVRPYHYGDDIRQIDWNVTARTGDPYIKVFEEEREQSLMLLVDISESGTFGSQLNRKIDIATELATVLAFSAIKNNDKVGLVLFTDQVEKVVLPRKGRQHVLRLIREIFHTKPKNKGTHIASALDYVNKILNRRSIVILISDFQDDGYQHQMKIMHRRHDLVNIFIQDPFEYQLPDLGIIPLYDRETGQLKLVDSSDNITRALFRKQKHELLESRIHQFTKMGIDTIQVNTQTSYIEPLMNFFKRRATRY